MGKTIGVVLALQDKCSPQLNKIAERLNISEKEAKKLHNRVDKLSKKMATDLKNAAKVVSVGFAAVSAACVGVTYKTMEAGDRIDKMSQKIGLSRQKYQQWDYILSQSGADIDKMQVGMKTLSQQMVASTKVGSDANLMFKQLGVSVKDSNGNFISQEEAFEKVITAFQKMPDGIEKANLAQKLFGKTGSDLRPLLNGIRGNIDELKEKYQALGLGMSDKAIDASVKFKDTMDSLSRSMQGVGYELGGELLPIAQSVADKIITNMPKIKATVTPIIKGISAAINTVIDTMNIWMPVMAGVVAAITTFKVVSGTVAVIKTLKTVIDAVRIAQGLWNVVMLANPIGLIAVGVGVLVAGVVLLWKNWDKVVEKVKIAFDWIKKVILTATPLGGIVKVVQFAAGKINEHKQNQTTPQYASGTVFAQGGYSLVGENGPEIIDVPRGSRVYNNSETKNIMNKGGNTYNFYFGDVYDKDEFIYKIRQTLGSALNTAMAV